MGFIKNKLRKKRKLARSKEFREAFQYKLRKKRKPAFEYKSGKKRKSAMSIEFKKAFKESLKENDAVLRILAKL